MKSKKATRILQTLAGQESICWNVTDLLDALVDVWNLEYMSDEEKQMDVSCLISYNSSESVAREYILSDNSFTIKALYRLGYKWPITDEKYLDRSIASLSTLGFFE